MFNIPLAEINARTDLTQFDFADSNYCLIFFHYDKNKTEIDWEFVKQFEKTFKYNLNWIDVTALYESQKELNEKLHFYENYNEQQKENVILNYIKEYIFDSYIRTGKYYKF